MWEDLSLVLLQVREANQMVEEMMLLANCTVAAHILAHFPACALLRKHAVPPPRQFEPLLRAASACGVDLDVSTSKVRTPGDNALRQANSRHIFQLSQHCFHFVHLQVPGKKFVSAVFSETMKS